MPKGMGELAGSLAHELNQPLTAILANAEAGAALLKRRPADLEEIAEILEDIEALVMQGAWNTGGTHD